MYSNKYIFFYAIGISTLTAVLLAFTAQALKPRQEANIELDFKTSILHSVHEEASERKAIEKTYGERVQELVINSQGEEIADVQVRDIVLKNELKKPVEDRQLALFVYTGTNGKKLYVIPMQGTGLWGPIYGYLSIEDDFSTIYGAVFSHKSETPGLGAEIAEQPFQAQFPGKKLFDNAGTFVSVNVIKQTAKTNLDPVNVVDGISGGTITSTGVDKMIEVCVKPYMTYFEKLKSAS